MHTVSTSQVAAIAYGIAFQVSTVSSWIWLIVHIYIQFFGVGLVLATLGWYQQTTHTSHAFADMSECLRTDNTYT